MKKPWVRMRHKLWYLIAKIPALIYLRLKFHFRYKPIKFDRKKRYFIISNHQTDVDSIMIFASLRKTVYTFATKTLLSSGLAGKFLSHAYGIIPKKKGLSDPKAIKIALKIAKEGGDIMVFPEGNRTYAEFQYQMDISLIKLIKKCNLPIMVLNITGGNGISPRFAKKPRKGILKCSLKEIIEKEEYAIIDDDLLLQRIKSDLKVYDSMSNQLFKSNHKAEYLERMLFVCPNCNKYGLLKSNKNYISCDCGLKVLYKENLHLEGNLESFKFNILNDWYQFQKKWVRDLEIEDGKVIFQDSDVLLYKEIPNKKRKLITKGNLVVTNNKIIFNNQIEFDVSKIIMASPISGIKLSISFSDESYLIKGNPRFNPLKYVFLFNRLDTLMKGNDIYYNIYDKE